MSPVPLHAPSISRDIIDGAKLGLPVVVASAPFGMLFGAVAVQNGLSVFEAVFATATIFGGASQMVGVELFGQNVAPWLIVLSIFAVNFRHILYSGALGRRIAHWHPAKQALGFFFLTDPQYAESEIRGERGETVSFAWYMGMAGIIYVFWLMFGWVGASFGRLVPDAHALGLDFLLPIYFLGMVMGFRSRPRWLPIVAISAIASIVAFKTIGSPWHVSVGAAAGVLFAALMPVQENEGDTP